MYRHLMVPLDDSALSAETAGKAVRLARTLGAKVTFFHAQEDYGATSVGALQGVIAPADFNEGMAGEARAILAKAEAVARRQASPRIVRDDQRPALRGDPRRRRAARLRPDLHRVARAPRHQGTDARLADAEGSAARDDPGARLVRREQHRARSEMRPLATIGDEHRSLAAVVHGLEFLVREAREGEGTSAVRRCCARSFALRQGVPGEAAPSEGRRVSVPQAARAHVRIRRQRSTSSNGSTPRAPADRRARQALDATTRRARAGGLAYSRPPSSASRRRKCSTWGSRRRSSFPPARSI